MGFRIRADTTENAIRGIHLSFQPFFSSFFLFYFYSRFQNNLGIMKHAHTSDQRTSFFSSHIVFLPPHFFAFISSPLIPFSSHQTHMVLSLILSPAQCLFFLCLSPFLYSTPLCSEVILSLLSGALFIIIIILFSLRTHTMHSSY